jgi:hypothetical protein
MRRAKRAVGVLATLVVLMLAGCSGSSSNPTSSTVTPAVTPTVETTPTQSTVPTGAPKFNMLDALVGHWKVNYELTSVKPASMRKYTANTPRSWECVVIDGQLTLTTGPRAYHGPVVMTGKAGGKGWNYKGRATYAGPGGEIWTNDLVVDGKMLTNDSFTVTETSTEESSARGHVYTAIWTVTGARIPDPS